MTTSTRYALQRKLGAGGMGDVWEGVDNSLGRRVAIKTIKPELAADPLMFARFRQEAEAAASLGHPNIIQVIELTNDDPPLLVMEMLDGRSLRDLLLAEGRLAPPRACFIALQILSALAAAHGARIVHRDIKPANVYVVKTLAVADFVKVLDFGIAKLLDRTLPDGSSPLTAWGDVLGTTAYMAPEQALGMPVDARADLFAVGAVLYEMLSGTRARAHGNANLRNAAFTPCRKLVEAASWIDPGLAAVVDRALALDPAHRFASAEQMVAALEPFTQGAGSDLRIDVMQTTRDAPPTMTAPPTVPATSSSHWQAPAPPVRVQAPPKSTSPILFIVIPIAVLGLLFTGVIGTCLYVGTQVEDEKGAFVVSRPVQPCPAPSTCGAPGEYVDGLSYRGARYGACLVPPPGPAEPYAVGDIVWVANGPLVEPHRVVEVPDVASYRVESFYGNDARLVLRGKVVGRVCKK